MYAIVESQGQQFKAEAGKYLYVHYLGENVKEGDSIDKILEDNTLNIEEFLIANSNIPNANALLTPGQTVSVGLISPIVTIVNENIVVEDIPSNYETEYQNDDTMYRGQTKVIQKGSNGLNRVTEEIQYKNGEC